MYKPYTSLKQALLTGTVALSLAFSSAAVAGPGKPGQNGIVEGGTIVDIALAVNEATGEFSNLLAAVLCFGPVENNPVVDLLSGTDKYTLFAPTDAAFEELLDRLEVTDPCELAPQPLLTVLQYHVVDGRRFSNSVFNRNSSKVIETLALVGAGAGGIRSHPVPHRYRGDHRVDDAGQEDEQRLQEHQRRHQRLIRLRGLHCGSPSRSGTGSSGWP